MAALFDVGPPFRSGLLDVGDGHRVYFEVAGAPAGAPIVVLHGGPGSGASAATRRHIDPNRCLIVQFDQRGCGRSTAHVADDVGALATITTAAIVADIEALRVHLGIERWAILAGSWGTTLALAYAARHADRITGMALRGTATTSAAEIDWVTRGAARLLPREWEAFAAHVDDADDLVGAYHERLVAEGAIAEAAARAWCDWEQALLSVGAPLPPDPRWGNARFRLCFARLVTHVWRNRAWLAEGALIAAARGLGSVPATLVHGRLDVASPLASAWAVHRAWPGSELVVVDGAGHDGRDTAMAEATRAAVQRIMNP